MKTTVTICLDKKVGERLRNAVYWSPGLTLSSVIEECVVIAVDELERRNGKPFEQRDGKLKSGASV